ncbi:MAG: hypothetical protein M1817_005637 [Caeruleum heppii]|nr:MAG: hypothetical protein M1817_005637 [Caeruleum heppii]
MFSGAGSDLTITGDGSDPKDTIKFEEVACAEAEEVSVEFTIRPRSEDRSGGTQPYFASENHLLGMAATIRQTMTRQGLSHEQPFRVVYTGSPLARDAVVGKVASALAVPVLSITGTSHMPPRSPRFNVVPISSFGAKVSPEVELIHSFGIELVVDECTAARMDPDSRGLEVVNLQLNNDYWVSCNLGKEGSTNLSSARWKTPHLAIFFCGDDESSLESQTRALVKRFMTKHDVPSIVISQYPQYEFPSVQSEIDHRSVHMCLESHGIPTNGQPVYRRLPIDLSSFLSIDCSQMNRNLACLTGLYERSEDMDLPDEARIVGRNGHKERCNDTITPHNLLARWTDCACLRYLVDQLDRCSLLIVAFLLLCAVGGMSLSLAQQPTEADVSAQSQAPASGHSSSHLILSRTATTVTSSVANKLTVGAGQLPTKVVSLSKVAQLNSEMPQVTTTINARRDVVRFLTDPVVSVSNESNLFKMQIIGDRHMILKPPHRLVFLRKAPKIFVTVHRGQQQLDAQLSRLFDGVFALKLDRDEAYGLLNVTVWAQTKPSIIQSFEVNFGSRWLDRAGWNRAWSVFESYLQRNSLSSRAGLRHHLGNLRAQARTFKQFASEQIAGPVEWGKQWTGDTQASLTGRIRDFSKNALQPGRGYLARLQAVTNGAYGDLQMYETRLPSLMPSDESLKYVRSVLDRAKRTFTLARAQKQARRLWIQMLSTGTEHGRCDDSCEERRSSGRSRKRNEGKGS